MKFSPKGGPVTHVRIESLRLRVAAGDARSAKALATAVASRLALRVDELASVAGRETIRVRVTAPASVSRERLADSIAGKIASPQGDKQGRR